MKAKGLVERESGLREREKGTKNSQQTHRRFEYFPKILVVIYSRLSLAPIYVQNQKFILEARGRARKKKSKKRN